VLGAVLVLAANNKPISTFRKSSCPSPAILAVNTFLDETGGALVVSCIIASEGFPESGAGLIGFSRCDCG